MSSLFVAYPTDERAGPEPGGAIEFSNGLGRCETKADHPLWYGSCKTERGVPKSGNEGMVSTFTGSASNVADDTGQVPNMLYLSWLRGSSIVSLACYRNQEETTEGAQTESQ